MAQFLYRISPTRPDMLTEGPTAEEAAIVGEHFEYLSNLVEKGIVFIAGRTTNNDARDVGIVVFTAESAEAAQQLMLNDPAVHRGVMNAELDPFRVSLWAKDGPST